MFRKRINNPPPTVSININRSNSDPYISVPLNLSNENVHPIFEDTRAGIRKDFSSSTTSTIHHLPETMKLINLSPSSLSEDNTQPCHISTQSYIIEQDEQEEFDVMNPYESVS